MIMDFRSKGRRNPSLTERLKRFRGNLPVSAKSSGLQRIRQILSDAVPLDIQRDSRHAHPNDPE